jgi:hypothetical protein
LHNLTRKYGFLVVQVKDCAYHNPTLMRASYLLIKINKAPEETFLAQPAKPFFLKKKNPLTQEREYCNYCLFKFNRFIGHDRVPLPLTSPLANIFPSSSCLLMQNTSQLFL